MSLLSTLHKSNTGLHASQIMVDVASNNIANASDEFYSRQKVIADPEKSLFTNNIFLGRGVDVQSVQRVHDNFVFDRYAKAKQDFSFADTKYAKLKQIAELFPDLQEVGILHDMQDYFNAWKDLANNPNDSGQKYALSQKATSLAQNIKNTRQQLQNLQVQISDELAVNIAEVNALSRQIADINAQLANLEGSRDQKKVNSLRDKRDELEFHLRELIGSNITKKGVRSDSLTDKNSVEFGGAYNLSVGRGFSLVDGANVNELIVQRDGVDGIARVAVRGYDFKDVDITNRLRDGKVGALISLFNSQNSSPGKLQKYIDTLDIFARGFMEATNRIYAATPAHEIAVTTHLQTDEAFSDSELNISPGSFIIKVHDGDGSELSRRTITLNKNSTMADVVSQLNARKDDNNDGNARNDFADFFVANFTNDGKNSHFTLQPRHSNSYHTISFQDLGTNFAGALGLNSFFTGNDARDISLNGRFVDDANAIKIGSTPDFGNFDVANAMQDLQHEEILFFHPRFMRKTDAKMSKISDFLQTAINKISNDTKAASDALETKSALLETTKSEHLAISQVSIDEEMINLIKFQGGYAANAKVISAIDEMLQTLLNIKS